MTERTFHRGAVVAVRQFVGEFRRWPSDSHWQWDLQRDKSSERTGAQLAAASKPSRQRRKGPIIRFGRKP